MLFEKLFHFLQVVLEESSSLTLELILNSSELSGVISSHVDKLRLHVLDKFVNFIVHAPNKVDIGFILDSYGFLEFSNQLILVVDDLLASRHLHLNILC
jgi:hypothetical protein